MSESLDATSSPTSAAALAESFAFCQRLTRQRAGNFYHGLKITPHAKRAAMYAVYAWMRAADDLADDPLPPAEKIPRLDAFRAATHAAARGVLPPAPGPGFAAMWPAVSATLQHYPINLQHLDDMLTGQLQDQQQHTYQRYEDLHEYCYRVAGTVGLVCISVWGYQDGAATRELAIQRGVALQLTNILRDLVEDARRGRVYLPVDELAAFDFTPESFQQFLQAGRSEPRFEELMRGQLRRALQLYAASEPLEAQIAPDCRGTCWAMMRIYRGLLEKMAAQPSRVLIQRVRLSLWTKACIAWRAAWGRTHG